MRDVMFAVVWLIALPISFAAPFSGILLWIWTAMLSPNELLYGFMAGVPLNKLIALTTLPLLLLGNEKKDFYLDTLMVLVLALGAIATLSWMFSILPSDDGTELYLKIVKIIVLAFAITTITKTRLRVHLIIFAVVISIGFLSVKEGLIFILTAGGHQIVGNGSIGDNNSLAATLLMITPLIYYLIRYSEVKVVRLALIGVLALTIITTVATFSRGGFIGLVVLSLLMLKNSNNKFISFVLIAFAALAIYNLAPEAWFKRLNTIETASNDDSFTGRIIAWKISLLIALDHPIFGGGPHAVQRFFVWNYYRPYLYKVDFFPTPPAEAFAKAAHSIYFEALGDMGFTGLFIYVALLVMAVWRCRTIVKLCRGIPALQWAGDLARMMQISILTFAVTAALLSMVYFELFYIFVAVISRCHRIVLQHVPSTGGELVQPSIPTRPGGFVPGPLALPPATVRLQQRR